MEVITIANNKGGVGKTMQAFQLSTHLANKGHRVLVIDLDSQANLSTTLGVNIQRTLIPEWLIGDVKAEDVILPSVGKKPLYKNLSVIASSRHLANMAKLLILSEGEIRKRAGRKERLLKIRLNELNESLSEEERFDFVVIDTPPMLGDELIMALVASTRIFIPTQAQDYSIDGLEELMDTFEIIKETENPGLEFSIIPSMVNPRRSIEKQRLQELQESFQVTPPIKNMVALQESISLQKPVCIRGKKNKGRIGYEALWSSLGL